MVCKTYWSLTLLCTASQCEEAPAMTDKKEFPLKDIKSYQIMNNFTANGLRSGYTLVQGGSS